MNDFEQFMQRGSQRFDEEIRTARPTAAEARALTWVYQPYDRCNVGAGPLATLGPQRAGLLLVESHSKGLRRPYHRKKLALVLASGRHFALEAATRGYRVLHVRDHRSFGSGLLAAQQAHHLQRIVAMRPAERELHLDLEEAVGRGLRLELRPDETWLSTPADFASVYGLEQGRPLPRSFLMDRFYRHIRNRTGILMHAPNRPFGDRYSFDTENRRPYRGQIPVPPRPSYPPDAITAEVLAFIAALPPEETFGTLDGFDWPCTEADAQHLWRFGLTRLLPFFGPYEDAMSSAEPSLFHSKISALVNLGRLLPAQLVVDVVREYESGHIPLASAEGFLRQLLGWREFMRHVHRVTDGYRNLNVFYEKAKPRTSGAAPSALHAIRPLPAAYWGVSSGLHCLDTVVAQVMREGWSHHITRLMVLGNLATLCGFSPRELCDWFWFAYVDAYEWVVESNVLGMGTFADGGVTATKPYVSAAAYIHRMSDYCGQCRYDPRQSIGPDACPFNALYWSFLERNRETLGTNHRMKLPYSLLDRKTPQQRRQLRDQAEETIARLETASPAGP